MSETALTRRPEIHRRSPLQMFVSDTIVITQRNVRRLLRTPLVVVFASIQPVMLVLLFRYVFSGTIRIPGYQHYVDYLIPGIIAQTTLFGGSSLAVFIAEDSTKGVIDRLRSLPMSRAAIITGATIATLLRTTFTLAVVVVVGVLVGFRFHTPTPQIVAASLVALLFGYSFSWVFAFIGVVVKNTEAAQIAAFLPIFPLVFAASTFTSPATMPDWLRAFAANQPITQSVDAIRDLTQGVYAASPKALSAIAWSLGILAVSACLTLWRFERA
jgi:ABC-2 type transport system permease protein